MMRQRVQAMLGQHRLVVVLVVLVILVGGGFAVVTRGATSLDITVWSHQLMLLDGQHPVPDVKIYDKTITDLGLVHNVQDQLDGGTSVSLGGGSCATGAVVYRYQFQFATLGVPTQVYYGQAGCPGWDASVFDIPVVIPVFHVAIYGVKLDGKFILDALHEKMGMPIQNFYGSRI